MPFPYLNMQPSCDELYQFRLRRMTSEETARAVSLQLIVVGTRHVQSPRLSSVYIIPMQTDLIL